MCIRGNRCIWNNYERKQNGSSAYAGSGRRVLCKKETAGEGSSDGGRRMCGVGRSSMDHRSGKRGADQGVQHEWQYILGTITVHEGCGRNDSDTSVRTGILWISLSADLLSDRCIFSCECT